MIIKYMAQLTTRWDCEAKITKVEVEKETEKCVWIKGRRVSKVSEFNRYFDTWEDANNALITTQKHHVESLRAQLQRSNSVFGNIKGMRNKGE